MREPALLVNNELKPFSRLPDDMLASIASGEIRVVSNGVLQGAEALSIARNYARRLLTERSAA